MNSPTTISSNGAPLVAMSGTTKIEVSPVHVRARATGGRWLYTLGTRMERARARLRSVELDAGDCKLRATIGGHRHGPALLFVHGFTGSKEIWNRCATPLLRHYRLIMIDLPGHGDSSSTQDLDYSVAAHSRRLRAILDFLDIDRAHVVGNSMGGCVAAHFAATHPQRVRHLILISPGGLRGNQLSALDLSIESGRNPFAVSNRTDLDELLDLTMYRPPYIPGIVREHFAQEYANRRERIELMYEQYVGSNQITHLLPALRAPTLILWGAQDRVIDPSTLARWSHTLPTAQTQLWPQVGHLPMLEVPRRCAHAIGEFLAASNQNIQPTPYGAGDNRQLKRHLDEGFINKSSHKLVETDMEALLNHIGSLISGEASAVLVKNALASECCDRIFANFNASAGRYSRTDGVSGNMVGTNAFLKYTDEIVDDYLRNNGFAEVLFHGANNLYRNLFDSIEDAGFRFRHAYINGVPAPTHRATVWTDQSSANVVLKAHTDWPQVAFSGQEYADVERPIAINFYPRHPRRGSSRVRLYDFVPEADWLEQRGILHSGYPIHLDELEDVPYLDIEPEAGDLLLFAAAKVHAVFNDDGSGETRLNLNGFFGLSKRSGRVLAWA